MIHQDPHAYRCPSRSRRCRRLVAHPLVLGVLALGWLILRSGRKPSRIVYPCQHAALGGAWLALGLPLASSLQRAASGSVRRRVPLAVLLAATAIVTLGGYSDTREARRAERGAASAAAPADYTAELYVVENSGGPEGDHHLGVDRLIACMGEGGLAFYRGVAGGAEIGPDGVVGAHDVVLIKINQQWGARGGTNTDVLRGLIARILEHPEGFAGEVVVVENTQGQGTLDWSLANAEDTTQSVLDVVHAFAGAGRPVSAVRWDDIRLTAVDEYAAGDLRDGYVVGPYQADTQISVSYPKFRTPGGRFVSLARGVWNPDSNAYDDERLTFLNVPVLKSHAAVYGVTACVKNHVGTMTTGLGTNTHLAVRHGGLGSFLAQVRVPDLNILDCIYVLARPDRGPMCPYADATRLDRLVAGRDPVALDLWATANLLVPAMIANGYTAYPKQDPFDPASDFRTYLDNTARELLEAGIPVTNDLARITAHVATGVAERPVAGDITSPLGVSPNPFSSDVVIAFAPRLSGTARLEVLDVTGRLRRTLRAAVRVGRRHEIHWDGRDGSGRSLPPGTYFVRLSGVGEPVTRRVTRVR